ncbi:hypothetical protein QX249_12760 [Vibrio parahaemolyticus]|uniref:Mitotic-spindle organizing protein 1 n=1 Tax=Vibrio parahaemolyticus TaxID=670 RepID=A0AAW8PZT2_VIBPH|nr:hypothetical protein [Vibrio parahaemolyticus]MDS1821536.1 hypothetical protein [Vibrio parahaemolyticus]
MATSTSQPKNPDPLAGLRELIASKAPMIAVASAIKSLIESGLPKSDVINFLSVACESLGNDEEYEDLLTDLAAAMEGWCSSDYMLHPSQLKSPAKDKEGAQ